MPEPIDTTGMMLGELKGQMRELIHTVNKLTQKVDVLAERVIGAAGLPAKVKDLEDRLVALETDKNKREGAMGFGAWLLKSPALGWFVGAAVSAWAILTGKVHP
jgi:hypothetical protein